MGIFLDKPSDVDSDFVQLIDGGIYVAEFMPELAPSIAEELVGQYAREYDIAKPDEIVIGLEEANRLHAMLTAASILSKDKNIKALATHLHDRVGERLRRIEG